MHANRLVPLVVLLAGCPDRTISEVPVDQDKIEVKDVPAELKNDLDILFVIDDSLSMIDEQTSLKANFPRLVGVLETLEGGLPDVQIGVVTPNLGTSAADGTTKGDIDNCRGQGEAGVLRELSPGGPRFLQSFDDGTGTGGRTTNFSGTLADAFSQLASVGTNGCGIEQHLEAMKRATDGSNAQNASFLRAGAYLAVIVIADEDDCSLANTALWTEPAGANYGDRINFRCTRQGVVCDTPPTPFDDATGPRQDCHPRDDTTELTLTSRYVNHLKSLKPDPRDLMVAGIVGDPENFTIDKKNGVTVLANACPAATGGNAAPAVRTGNFVSQFGNSTNATICDADLSGGLQQIGALIANSLESVCFENNLADVDPAPGPQYDCSVVEVRRHPGEPDEELRTFPNCDTGAFPCWRVEEDAAKCFFTKADPHLKLVIDYNGEATGPDIHVKAQCVTTDSSAGPL